MSHPPPLLIYGAGGHAREVAWLATACDRPVTAYIDDSPTRVDQIDGIPVISFDDARRAHPDSEVVIAVGDPSARERLATRVAESGLGFSTLIHPSVELSPSVEVGAGSVVMAGTVITVNVGIGRHVQINVGCTISHDCRLDDHATLAPGVHLSGAVHVGRAANLGTGAVVINGSPADPLAIGAGAVVGAGACVIQPVDSGTTVVGVPARPVET